MNRRSLRAAFCSLLTVCLLTLAGASSALALQPPTDGGLGGATPPASGPQTCPSTKHLGNDGVPGFDVVAHNVPCGTVDRLVSHADLEKDGASVPGWKCRVVSVTRIKGQPSTITGARIGCAKGNEWFRFSWAT